MSALPDLPTGWHWKTVEELASDESFAITDGPFGSNLKTSHYTESGPRVIRLQNIGDSEFNDAHAHISIEHYERLSKHSVKAGDIVIAALGEALPRACVIPESVGPAIVKADCVRFRPNPAHNARYLNYALNSEGTRRLVRPIVHGVGRPRLNLREIKSIPLAVAPREQQDLIVQEIEEQLTRLQAGVAALKRVQANLKRYRAAVLKAACEGRLVPTEAALARREGRPYEPASALLERIMATRRELAEDRGGFHGKRRYAEPPDPDTRGLPVLPEDWCWASVESISTKVVDGVHKKPAYVPSGVPFVTVKNLTAGPGISFEDLNHVTESDHLVFTRRARPERGDLLISKDGTLGVVRQVQTDEPFSIFVSVALIKPVLRETSSYLEVALASPQVQAQMVPKGSGLQHIHLEDLRADCVPLAPLAEQRRIVAEVERRISLADALDSIVFANLHRATRLRQSTLAAAFRGDRPPTLRVSSETGVSEAPINANPDQ